MRTALRMVGTGTSNFFAETGALGRLAWRSTERAVLGPFRGERFRLRLMMRQAVRAGYDSLFLASLISMLLGMIMALQSAYQLRELGAMTLVADLVAVAITRELAPLLTAIIVASRFGSAVAAELGTMKVTQEIDALTVMGIDPVSFLVVPRILALFIALPCLTIYSNLVGILGGFLVAVTSLGMGGARYIENSLHALQLEDLVTGLVKALAFAGILGLVACHQGLATRGGAEGVGHATTMSVVRSIVLVIVIDLFVTAIFYVWG